MTHDLIFHGKSYIEAYIHTHSPILFYTRVANDQNYNEFHSATMLQIPLGVMIASFIARTLGGSTRLVLTVVSRGEAMLSFQAGQCDVENDV